MKYSIGEEIANAISHGIGAIFGIVALILMVITAAIYGNAWQVVSVSIYGATLIILFTMSTLYHALVPLRAKKVFKVFDHASIYLLIAGTYTPYTLITLREEGAIGWIIFGIVWGMAVLGITFSSIFRGKIKILEFITYLVMGYAVVFAIPSLFSIMKSSGNIAGLYWLLAGGLAYTIGAVFYKIKIKYFHFVWHIFVLLGSVFHFISIMFYVL